MILWAVRNSGGDLMGFKEKPERTKLGYFDGDSDCFILDSNLFPQITWANSPQRIMLKYIGDGRNDNNT